MFRVLALLLVALPAQAAVQSRTVDYAEGDAALEGFLAHDGAQQGQRPGVVIVHQWMGITDHERSVARELAALGYVALAADVYGKDQRPADRGQAAKIAGRYKNDRPALRRRVAAAVETLRKQPGVDPQRIVAIGYCFGGTAVLELARSGADLRGVVSLHGGLGADPAVKSEAIRAQVLVLHGAADPHVPPAEVQAFEQEMAAAKADWQLIAYGGAVHAFTQKEAGDDPSKGAAYDAAAARRSWQHLKLFLDDVFSAG